MERIAQVLYGIAAGLLLVALALRLIPAPASAAPPSTRPATDAAMPRQSGQVPPDSVTAVVRGNVFAPSRSAPKTRYTPPDLIPPAAAPARRGAEPARLRLFGTVLGPLGTAALIDADPRVRGAEIYHIGDTLRGRRIVAVSESTVVLTGEGGGGRMVLRLQPTPPLAR